MSIRRSSLFDSSSNERISPINFLAKTILPAPTKAIFGIDGMSSWMAHYRFAGWCFALLPGFYEDIFPLV